MAGNKKRKPHQQQQEVMVEFRPKEARPHVAQEYRETRGPEGLGEFVHRLLPRLQFVAQGLIPPSHPNYKQIKIDGMKAAQAEGLR